MASPILSNIYLDRLDRFVEQRLLSEHNRGRRRRSNPAYQAVEDAIARAKRRGDREAVRALRRQRRTLPSQDPADPDYRGCGMSGMQTIGYWGLLVPNVRPPRSSRESDSSA